MIYIPQQELFSLLSNLRKDKTIDTSLFDKAINSLGIQSFSFGQLPSKNSHRLISGSVPFVNEQLDKL